MYGSLSPRFWRIYTVVDIWNWASSSKAIVSRSIFVASWCSRLPVDCFPCLQCCYQRLFAFGHLSAFVVGSGCEINPCLDGMRDILPIRRVFHCLSHRLLVVFGMFKIILNSIVQCQCRVDHSPRFREFPWFRSLLSHDSLKFPQRKIWQETHFLPFFFWFSHLTACRSEMCDSQRGNLQTRGHAKMAEIVIVTRTKIL